VARHCAPYCHARLAAVDVEHSGSASFALRIIEELVVVDGADAPGVAPSTNGEAQSAG
jgi:hypothetical protein